MKVKSKARAMFSAAALAAIFGTALPSMADGQWALVDSNPITPICRITVTNSRNPSVWPDGVYNFDVNNFMDENNPPLYCDPNSPFRGYENWTWIVDWMGV